MKKIIYLLLFIASISVNAQSTTAKIEQHNKDLQKLIDEKLKEVSQQIKDGDPASARATHTSLIGDLIQQFAMFSFNFTDTTFTKNISNQPPRTAK